MPKPDCKKLIAKIDKISYTKLINLYTRFSELDLGSESKAVEKFSWKSAPWAGLTKSHGQDGTFVLFAKYMTYMYFDYPHTLIRLWRKVASEWPDDELVARLCLKVLMQGVIQGDLLPALMEPAVDRGERDWIALARDTMAEPSDSAAERLVAWAAPRRIQGLQEYLAPFMAGFPSWTRKRIDPLLAQMDAPAADAPAAPVSTPARQEHLERTLREATEAGVRIQAFQALGELGEGTGLTGDALEEARLDWLGFDAGGRRALAYASHEIHLQIGPDLGLLFEGQDGKLSKSPPRKTKPDDAEQIASAKEEIKAIKKALRDQAKACAKRLDRALTDSRRWPVLRWRVIFCDHPVLARIGRALVFERIGAGKEIGAFFTIGEDAAIEDADGKALALDPDAQVRLAHPLRMTPAQMERLGQRIAARPMAPPVAQLDREETCELRSAEFVRENKPVDPTQIDPVVYSEAVMTLRGLARLDK
jgi:hypothetical protein